MSQKRKPRSTAAAASARTPHPTSAAKPRKHIKLPRFSSYIVTFALLWFFCSSYYSDVFYMANQYSYFAFDATLMHFLLQQPMGWLMAAGRMLLTTFHYPALGGALLALMLTLSGRLLVYILRLPPRARWTGNLVAFAPVAYFMYLNYNLYYQSEPSIVFTLPLVMLVVLAVVALAIRLITGQHLKCSLRGSDDDTPAGRALGLVAALVLTIGLFGYAQAVPQQNTRLVCTMQRMLEQRNWEGMRRCGLEARQPDRGVAAYYALGLMQLDRLPDDLFAIHFHYPKVSIDNRAGEHLDGAELYTGDLNFYSGLINPAYQEAMTSFVGDGPSVITIKQMALCAVLNGEKPLAERYFHMLRQQPFEGAFIEKYEPLMQHPEKLADYPELKLAYDLRPTKDSFEQFYKQPLFLGYYTEINAARVLQALRLSYAACLYAKALPQLAQRVAFMRGQQLPQPVEDALAIMALQHPEVQKLHPISQFTQMRLQEFLARVAQLGVEDRKKTGEALRDEYENYYPFYYFFENLPEDAPKASTNQKGGVN